MGAAGAPTKCNERGASYYDCRPKYYSPGHNPYERHCIVNGVNHCRGLDKRDGIPNELAQSNVQDSSNLNPQDGHPWAAATMVKRNEKNSYDDIIRVDPSKPRCRIVNGKLDCRHVDSEEAAASMVKRNNGASSYFKARPSDGNHWKRDEVAQNAIQDGNPPSNDHLPLLPPGVNPYIRGRKGHDSEPDLEAELVKMETADKRGPSFYDYRPPAGHSPYGRHCIVDGVNHCRDLKSEDEVSYDVLEEEAV